MWKTVRDFYSSREWREFRRKYINDKIKDGIIIDEYNGEAITGEIILHHKQELTDNNINDYSISLNPDNIIAVSAKTHNEIHKRFGYENNKKVYLVSGAPCSGKTTFVKKMAGMSDIVFDFDAIYYAITGQRKSHWKPKAVKQNAFELRDLMFDMIKTRTGKWQRAFVITTANGYELERLANKLGGEIIKIDATEKECLQRLYNDADGRDIEEYEKMIRDYYK